MKIKTLLMAMVLVLSAGLRAQAAGGVGFGLKAGMDFSDVHYSSSSSNAMGSFSTMINNETKHRTGITGGAFINFPIKGFVSLQPELIYAQKNWKIDSDIVDWPSSYYKFNASYVEVPVLAKLALIQRVP